jgi:hypothetical protein
MPARAGVGMVGTAEDWSHSLHARHASECTVVCGTGQPLRLATTLNRVHLLQLDLDPDQTRSATLSPRSPRSNMIGNFKSPITPIKHDRQLQLLDHPDRQKHTHNTPETHHDVIIDLPLVDTHTDSS